MPAISVLVPVRGDAAFLPQALSSLRGQDCAEWEALLCGVGEARLPAPADPRQRNVGTGASHDAEAVAMAATQARGEFLCVLDGDDLLAAGALSALLAALHGQPDAGMAYSRHVLVDAAGKVLGNGPLCELPYSPHALLLDFMTGPLQLVRREAWARAGGWRCDYPDGADYDLCLRLSETCRIVHVPQALYARRVHPQAPAVLRWAGQIEDRYRAFVAAVRRRGLDACFDCALEVDSWHVLHPLPRQAAAADWRPRWP